MDLLRGTFRRIVQTFLTLEPVFAMDAFQFNAAQPLTVMTQDDFAAVLRDHASWILSEGKEGRRANLKDTDLRRISFSEAHLARASFRGADLSGADLTGAELQEADFTEARLDAANLTGVNLERSNFASAQLERATMDGANLAYANFMHASLNDASLRNTMMEKAVLRQAQANRAMFDGTDMTDVNAREGSFQGAQFHRTLMPRADFRDSRCDNAVFSGVLFEQTLFKDASMSGVDFGHADFAQAIEIAHEYKAAALSEQKDKLREQRDEIDRMMRDVAGREQGFRQHAETVERDKETLLDLHRQEQRHSLDLKRRARGLGILSALWLLVLLAVCALSYLLLADVPAGNYNSIELAIVVAGPAFVFLLSVLTTVKVSGAALRLRRQIDLRESKLFLAHHDVHESTNATSTPKDPAPEHEPDLILPQSSKRFGRRR